MTDEALIEAVARAIREVPHASDRTRSITEAAIRAALNQTGETDG